MNAKIAIIEKNEIQLLMAEISLISVSGGSLFRRRRKAEQGSNSLLVLVDFHSLS
jgi:hypothetical protein